MSGPPPIADRPTEEHLGKNGGEAGGAMPNAPSNLIQRNAVTA
jgi:hypothetical protein